ncbi:heat shock protein beta-11-like [Cebidichthys violaceus]|uniref:heat shock protein beta-11-like n=1 Tax=Cebidichthys violaceus TaxID=271503 RepID=UPI0035CBE0C5
MLCPSVFQPSPFTTRSLLDLDLDPVWPVRSLWPETRPLLHLVEREVLRLLLEMRRSTEHMERLHRRIFEEIDQTWSRRGAFETMAVQGLAREGGGFALSLDTQAFSPEQLSVKQVGRKLRVSGQTDRKQDSSCSSSCCQDFMKELQLPDGVDHEAVTCSLVGGRLQIQAPPERALHDGKERLVPIRLTSSITSSSSSSSSESSPAEK